MTKQKIGKLSYGTTILVGLGFMTISAFWQMYEFKIPLILKNTFEIGDTMAGVIMSLDNVVALLLIPVFGALSDKTHTRIGRRMPYIIFGTIIAIVLMMFIPLAAQQKQLAFFIITLAFLLIVMATYRSPAVALMPDVTPKPLRSKGNAVINLMGAVGGALFLGLNAFLSSKSDSSNNWTVFITAAVIMLIGTAILYITVKEPKLVKKMHKDSKAMGIDDKVQDINDLTPIEEKLPKDVRKSMGLILASIALWFIGYNAITTAFSKYSIVQLGMSESKALQILFVATIAATIAFLPVGLLSTKMGRKKSILIGIIILTSVFATATFYKSFTPIMYISFSLAGLGWALINVNSLPMVLEMSKDASVGKYTGYYYTFSMAAQIVTPIASGYLLEHVGYYTLFPYAAFFIGLASITMLMVKHGDSKPIAPKSVLESFDVED